jgi:hypothetical protein
MKPTPLDELYFRAAKGREDAYLFLRAFHAHAHAVDDDIDEPGRSRVNTVDRCVEVSVLCSSSFWRQHHEALSVVHALIASTYATSVIAPEHPAANILRLSGNLMPLAVAYLCGGWIHLQAIAQELWPIVTRDQLSPEPPTATA